MSEKCIGQVRFRGSTDSRLHEKLRQEAKEIKL